MDGPVLLYLHIPKTAGTSLTSVIYDQYNDSTASYDEGGMFCDGIYYYPGEPDLIRAKHPFRTPQSPKILQSIKRTDLRAVVGHFAFGLHKFIDRPTTYATMLRHPVDRIVSLYYHLKEWPRYAENQPWLERAGHKPLNPEASFEDFVHDYALPELDNDQTRRVAGEDPEFGHCTRRLLELARSNLEEHFSLVGVTERFDETLLVATHILGWSSQPQGVKKLMNEHRQPTSSIAPKTREAILDRNALDLELFLFANSWLNDHLSVL
jgi:hypothetical protein